MAQPRHRPVPLHRLPASTPGPSRRPHREPGRCRARPRGMTRKLGALLAVVLLLLGACGSEVPGDAGRIDAKLVSDLKAGDAQAVARAVDAFGFDLFRQVADGKQNTIT